MRKLVLTLALAGALTSPAVTAEAAGIAINFDTFGTLAGATFGGSGIPNDAVAISTFAGIGDDVITIGLTAHERFAAPAVGNDGAGTFYAETGSFDPPGSSPDGALWNFAFYVSVANGNFGDYSFDVLYEFDPGTATDISLFGALNLNAAIVALGGNPAAISLVQDSQNLLFGFLSVASGFVTPPAGSFNPFAGGEYTIALRTRTAAGVTLDTTAIEVETVPEPATLTLLMLGGAAGLARARRRQRS